jgi:UDP-2,4-diacetamido-2,4,6-trideoxy-beta-L-altropyranose hydrolase
MVTKQAIIRADSSSAIGSGHVTRCLTLADLLRDRGYQVSFISRDWPGNITSLVERAEHGMVRLGEVPDPDSAAFSAQAPDYSRWLGVDWQTDVAQTRAALDPIGSVELLVVDHYGIDHKWENKARDFARRIVVIDDLANRKHDCDILLDQNYYVDAEQRYDGLVDAGCERLVGPKFALLRPEFRKSPDRLKPRDGHVRRLLILLGGSDPCNATSVAIEAVRLLRRTDLVMDVVVGAKNPHGDAIRALCSDLANARFHCQAEDIAELMASADLAIGAGGSTTWERCYMGLPTVTLVISHNQLRAAKDLASAGVILLAGEMPEVKADSLSSQLAALLDSPERIREMSERAVRMTSEGDINFQNVLIDKIAGAQNAEI